MVVTGKSEVARRKMKVDELEGAIELSSDEKMTDFQSFLQVEGGSFLNLALDSEGRATVELVHETLRSFLVNPARCPLEFHVDLDAAHSHAAATCLNVLSSERTRDMFFGYAVDQWSAHLEM